jgi:hypothetical protein
MTSRASVIVDAEGEPPQVYTGVVAYVVIDNRGVLNNGQLTTVNPRVLADALQWLAVEFTADADARGIPPLDPGQYPRDHRRPH